MAHLCDVKDKDTHFLIDPETMVITNPNANKNKFRQGDHNSEVLTFEINKEIESHNFSDCNSIRIHFINIGADKISKNEDVYEVTDITIPEDAPDKLLFSWKISDNATMYQGLLSFCICFACIDDNGNYTYRKFSEIFEGISISKTYDNAPIVIERYSDVLEQWKKDLQNLVTDEKINKLVTDYLERNPVEVPEALPNPHALTLTGAVEAEYDGSQPLSVALPFGNEWEHISTVTLEEEVWTVTISENDKGEAFSYNSIFYHFVVGDTDLAAWHRIKKIVDGKEYSIGEVYGTCVKTKSVLHMTEHIGNGDYLCTLGGQDSTNVHSINTTGNDAPITHFLIVSQYKFPAGTVITVYGRK